MSPANSRAVTKLILKTLVPLLAMGHADADEIMRLTAPRKKYLHMTPLGHAGYSISSMAFSRDGQRIAYIDKTNLRVVEIKSGETIAAFSLGCSEPTEIVSLQDDSTVTIAEANGALKSFALDGGLLVKEARPSSAGYWSIARSPNGSYLALASADHTVSIVDAGDLHVIWQKGECQPVVAFLAGDCRIVFVTDGGVISEWQQVGGISTKTSLIPNAGIYGICTSIGNGIMVTKQISNDAESSLLGIWDLCTYKLQYTACAGRPESSVLEFSPDGKVCLCASPRKSELFVMEIASGNVAASIETDGRRISIARWCPRSEAVAVCTNDSQIELWQEGAGAGDERVPSDEGVKDLVKKLGCECSENAFEAIAKLTILNDRGVEAISGVFEYIGVDPKLLDEAIENAERSDSSNFDYVKKSLIALDAEPELMEKMGALASPQARGVLRAVVEELDHGARITTPGALRRHRSIMLLERIGSAAAVKLLRQLSDSAPWPRVREDSTQAIHRIERQQKNR